MVCRQKHGKSEAIGRTVSADFMGASLTLTIVLFYSLRALHVDCRTSFGSRKCIDEYVPFRPVVFVHVFKTGGSSMREVFRCVHSFF